MDAKRAFATQSLILIVLFNAAILAVVYLTGGEAVEDRALTILGIGALLTLALWYLVQLVGKRFITAATPPPTRVEAPEAVPERPVAPALPPVTPAVQILSILQRKGRLIDFLQEDLQGYSDAQIGAAVRAIHEGCRQALAEHVKLEPIFPAEEGSEVTIEPGFDAHAIRLTGNVTGDPPFKGSLRHRGWRVVRLDLPKRTSAQGDDLIVAAAEVEVTA